MASSTAAFADADTCGEPLTTRDTVPRPTPARAATSSRVGRPADRMRPTVTSSSPRLAVRRPAPPYSAPTASAALLCSLSRLRRYGRRQRVSGNDTRVPVGARLRDAPLVPVVHREQSEPAGVAPCPLEVVQQRPGEVSPQRHPRRDRV